MTTADADATKAIPTPASLFNGYIGANVLQALHDLGVLRRWEEGESRLGLLAPGADRGRLAALLQVMDRLGFAEVDAAADTATLTPAGRDLLRQQGFFTWCVAGHGAVWRDLAGLTEGRLVFGRDVVRDGAKVALGCAEADRLLMSKVQDEVLGSIDFACTVDIGCGGGDRLLRLCDEDPGRRGIGIDISEDACLMAEARARELGLDDRVEFVRADFLALLGSGRTFPEADLVISIFMLHDMFASTRDHPQLIRSLRAAFPAARYFLLADTAAQERADRAEPAPIFSLGFELAHAFMGVRLHERAAYEEAFEAGGLKIARREPFGAPSTWLYLLEAV